jgi:hypothetical protein
VSAGGESADAGQSADTPKTDAAAADVDAAAAEIDSTAVGEAALAVARELGATVEEIPTKLDLVIERLNEADRLALRVRALVRVAALVSAVALGLSGVVAWLLIELHGNQIQGCHIGNDNRATNRQLWDHILSLSGQQPPPPGETLAQQEAQATAFRLYVHRKFSPVDCAKVYG